MRTIPEYYKSHSSFFFDLSWPKLLHIRLKYFGTIEKFDQAPKEIKPIGVSWCTRGTKE